MNSPFPGMDPYLEKHWRDVQARLIVYASDRMQGILPGDLLARVDERLIHARQNEPATETFIEIVDVGTGGTVVTVIEFLSQANKQPGDGQDKYRQKQEELRSGKVNLVEIDLLRGGQRVFMAPRDLVPPARRTPYQACIWRAARPDTWEHYAFPLAQPLPAIPIPLREQDADVDLHLQPLIDQCYENGRYHTLDYSGPPDPPLDGDAAQWADQLLRACGKR